MVSPVIISDEDREITIFQLSGFFLMFEIFFSEIWPISEFHGLHDGLKGIPKRVKPWPLSG